VTLREEVAEHLFGGSSDLISMRQRLGVTPGGLEGGVLIIHDVPLLDVPVTPLSYQTGYAPRGDDKWLFRIASAVGRICGYAGERNGAIVQDVFPVREDADLPKNSSSQVTFGFHTENAHHPHPPLILGLLCLRSDRRGDCTTFVGDCEMAFEGMSPAGQSLLGSRTFHTAPGKSFMAGTARMHPIRAILNGEPLFQFNVHNTTTDNAAAQEAFVEFVSRLSRSAARVRLVPGDLVLLSNYRFAHSRGPFEAGFDGGDRWLRRFYVLPASVGSTHPEYSFAALLN